MSATLGEAAASTKNEELEELHYAAADFNAEDATQVSFKRGDKVFVKQRINQVRTKDDDAMEYIALFPGPFPAFVCCLLKLDHAYFTIEIIHISSLIHRPIPMLCAEIRSYIIIFLSWRYAYQ